EPQSTTTEFRTTRRSVSGRALVSFSFLDTWTFAASCGCGALRCFVPPGPDALEMSASKLVMLSINAALNGPLAPANCPPTMLSRLHRTRRAPDRAARPNRCEANAWRWRGGLARRRVGGARLFELPEPRIRAA